MTTQDSIQTITNVFNDWSIHSARLLKLDHRPLKERGKWHTGERVDIEAAAVRAIETLSLTAPNEDGYVIPLHAPEEPKSTHEYVVWRDDREALTWFDAGFGVNGTTRTASSSKLEDTHLAWRL